MLDKSALTAQKMLFPCQFMERCRALALHKFLQTILHLKKDYNSQVLESVWHTAEFKPYTNYWKVTVAQIFSGLWLVAGTNALVLHILVQAIQNL